MGFKLSPCVGLIYLTFTNIMIYADRGILSSIIKVLESEEGMNLSSAEAGSLGSFFMLGFMLTGFFFAHYSQRNHPYKIISIGLFLWSLTALATGLSRKYWHLAVSRGLSGVGEVSFACLGPPLVMQYAPERQKTTWIAFFYAAIALGFSFGYTFGAFIYIELGKWFYPFYIEAGIIFLLSLFALLVDKDEDLNVLEKGKEPTPLCEQMNLLIKNPQFVFVVIGFTAYIFTVGAIGFWVIEI